MTVQVLLGPAYSVVTAILPIQTLEMNVYEAAVSSSVTPLRVWSVANRSNSVSVPDFTGSAWESNKKTWMLILKDELELSG